MHQVKMNCTMSISPYNYTPCNSTWTCLTGCAWEGGSLRISLSVDSFIYFANIRPDYKWSYFANVIVYCYNRADKEDTAVVFWNYKTGDVRYINLLK